MSPNDKIILEISLNEDDEHGPNIVNKINSKINCLFCLLNLVA